MKLVRVLISLLALREDGNLDKMSPVGVQTALAETRNQHEEKNDHLESRLQEAISDVATCSSETSLDEKVSRASEQLDTIEESYRTFHANCLSVVSQHPGNAARLNRDLEEKLLCLLSLQALQPAPGEAFDPTSNEKAAGKLFQEVSKK